MQPLIALRRVVLAGIVLADLSLVVCPAGVALLALLGVLG
jgi:hypothetical protein